jgi:Molybdopterin oxidoreductase
MKVHRSIRPIPNGWRPRLWASIKPFGAGEQHPNNFWEVFRAAWENRDKLGYALRILNEGVCDGCSLGTNGMRDWTVTGIHLCNIRLRLLRLNTMPALDIKLLDDVRALREKRGRDLRALGRLPYPMVRRRGEPGFRRVAWEEALGPVAAGIKASRPERLYFYLTTVVSLTKPITLRKRPLERSAQTTSTTPPGSVTRPAHLRSKRPWVWQRLLALTAT